MYFCCNYNIFGISKLPSFQEEGRFVISPPSWISTVSSYGIIFSQECKWIWSKQYLHVPLRSRAIGKPITDRSVNTCMASKAFSCIVTCWTTNNLVIHSKGKNVPGDLFHSDANTEVEHHWCFIIFQQYLYLYIYLYTLPNQYNYQSSTLLSLSYKRFQIPYKFLNATIRMTKSVLSISLLILYTTYYVY